MAKQMSGVFKIVVSAGKAAPSPPLGPALGQVRQAQGLQETACSPTPRPYKLAKALV